MALRLLVLAGLQKLDLAGRSQVLTHMIIAGSGSELHAHGGCRAKPLALLRKAHLGGVSSSAPCLGSRREHPSV